MQANGFGLRRLGIPQLLISTISNLNHHMQIAAHTMVTAEPFDKAHDKLTEASSPASGQPSLGTVTGNRLQSITRTMEMGFIKSIMYEMSTRYLNVLLTLSCNGYIRIKEIVNDKNCLF
jgi:hypothetical protein